MRKSHQSVRWGSSRFVSKTVSKTIRNFVVTVSALVLASTAVLAQPFPTGPDSQVTPGETCDRPNAYRYPEQIAYCNRNVDSGLKRDIIVQYDKQLGYQVSQMPRNDFKIDHYIPLCMGGGNDRKNLWPQHKSVYEITDPLEQEMCIKMSEGVLKQARAIDLMRRAKNNLKEVDSIRKEINAL